MELQQLHRPLEIKSVSETGQFSGYGSVFDNVDRGDDLIERGAFSESLANHKSQGSMPALLWQHRMDEPIGAITLVREDKKGLYIEGELATKTTRGAEAYELMKLKAVSGLSIGYQVPPGGNAYDSTNRINRLKRIDLWEVSIVTVPMNPQATVSAVKQALESKTHLERFLRNAGMSRAQAKALIAGGYPYLNPRQADADQLASIGEKAKSLTANILKSMQGN